MKKNIYLSYIHSDSMNFKFKLTDKFKGRKYKFSDEAFDPMSTGASQTEDDLMKLAKKISHMDVTVVFISRNILESKWIPYEVEYSLDVTKYFDKITKPKGIVGVVIPDKGNDYSYFMSKGKKGIWGVDKTKLPRVIAENIHNEVTLQNKNNVNYDSFISVYRWEDFVRNFDICIDAAFDKATNYFEDYVITKKNNQ